MLKSFKYPKILIKSLIKNTLYPYKWTIMEPLKEEHKTEEKSFVRRDKLIKFEREAQNIWEEHRINEINPKPGQKKFMVTFPYPYMNGRLHLGHAYSMSKCEYTIRFKRLKGYNAFWPFGYHCTGMPIVGAAERLRREFEAHPEDISSWAKGLENKFREEVEAVKQYLEKETAEKKEKDKLSKEKNKQKDSKGVIPVGGVDKDKKEKDEKPKVTVKLPQYAILKMVNIPENEIKNFIDPNYWLKYFPPYAMEDLKKFGVHVDHRRSFVTTDLNPYYDSFIAWQFQHLKQNNKISFGKRPTIFSTADLQPCADHDRAEGEGVTPQEYTLIKLKIVEPLPASLEKLAGKPVYLVAATLRPETLYGQTNCFVLPTGKYGAYEMKNDEIFICSDRSARNMAWQDLTKNPEKHVPILEILGEELIGLKLKVPLTPYDHVYSLPMMNISMEKGTGIVTGVPSDAPDDWAALRDLQKKPAFREKFKIKDEWVLPYEPVPIIEVPGYGNFSALKACEEFKVNSQNDKEQLIKAKDTVYLKGFYSGVLLVGKYKGSKVAEAKPLIKDEMIKAGEACVYYEPEAKVVSRSGDLCVVSYCDQWYLKYGEEAWKSQILNHIKSDQFNSYNEAILKAFEEAIDWLKEWAVSRTIGLGTRLPWDKNFIIESLSDSGIYMAYYTIAHHLQGDILGSKEGLLSIKPTDLTIEVWDYIFLNGPYPANCNIPEDKLVKMREEFTYFYPVDLRCSGKDLIRNHLTMILYNHAAIWPTQPNLWPRGYFCNGYILVNNQKMSKSLGNFMTLDDCIREYGADATRIALADAGDTLDDANFVYETADSAVLRLSNLEVWIKSTLENNARLRTEESNVVNEHIKFVDNVFSAEIDRAVHLTEEAFESMRFRDVLKYGFFDLTSCKEEYKLKCGEHNMRLDLVLKYIETQLLILYPICPHFAEIVYKNYVRPYLKEDKPKLISFSNWPNVDPKKIEYNILSASEYTKKLTKQIRSSLEKLKSKDPKKQTIFKSLKIIIKPEYYDWQKKVLEILGKYQYTDEGEFKNPEQRDEWKKLFKEDKSLDQDIMKKALMFGAYILQEMKEIGAEALLLKLPYNEREILKGYIPYLKKEFQINDIEAIEAGEAAKLSSNKVLLNAANNSLLGRPQLMFE